MTRALLLVGLVVLASCSVARDAATAAVATATTGVASNDTASPAPTSRAVATPATTVAAPKRQLTITAFGFGLPSSQFSISSLGYAFTIRNENASEAAESVSVQVAFTDAAGTVVATESKSIAYMGPGEHSGFAGTSFGSGANKATKMTVQALPSRWTAVAALPTFTFTNVAYIPDQFSSKVTGIIKSPFAKDYKTIEVDAIGVDANGQIVGGGYTYQDFVPANGTAAASVGYTGAKPATVVMYAHLSSLSLLTSP